MVVQRGTSTWSAASADSQTQHQQTQETIQLIKQEFIKQEYDTDSMRATSVVVSDSSRASPALRCNVVVPSSGSSVDSQGLVEWKFFQPAVDNIRNNLGTGSVSEEHVRDVCRQILEDAKQMYCSSSQSRGSSPFNELSDSETGSIGEYRFGRPSVRVSVKQIFKKIIITQKLVFTGFGFKYTILPTKKLIKYRVSGARFTNSEASQSARRKRSKPRPPGNFPADRSTPLKVGRGEPIRREGPKWDPARIMKDTLFVMGARANKVLGFGQTRGRLYIKHPGLFKYSGDQEDKEWLSRHNLMPPTGGKAYLMVLEDIRELAETDEYRNNPNLLLHELKGFEAPDFMQKKIRSYASHMRTDGLPDSKKAKQHGGESYEGADTNFTMRKESDTDSEASQSARRKRSKPRPPGNFPADRSTPLKVGRGEPIRREGPKWDPARIMKDTLFVMGARANKVLGFGQTRGRLYIKHPGLFKYSGDQEDKEWLSRHNLMPPTGGKAYLMVLEDIRELAETDEYRNNPNLLLHELKGFEAPDFMQKKIRSYASHMRTDGLPDSKKAKQHGGESYEGADTNFTMMQGRLGLAVDCVSSAMTPPATVLDSDGSPYMNLQEVSPDGSHHNLLSLGNTPTMITSQGLVSTSHHSLVTTYTHVDSVSLHTATATPMSASHATLSALLSGQITSDNSQEGVE
ncbi:hypothetical protein C0J52_13780 [Blattella germanica]|nr:hypothetical protein C0J52_13780 [Blattella germanica]